MNIHYLLGVIIPEKSFLPNILAGEGDLLHRLHMSVWLFRRRFPSVSRRGPSMRRAPFPSTGNKLGVGVHPPRRDPTRPLT